MRVWVSLLPLLTGCLEIGKTTYRFDTAKKTGTLVLSDVRTDTAADAAKDFGELVNSYVLGNKVSEDHPAWTVGERRLYASEGTLAGEVSFTFARESDVGLYQYDKKSPFLWCAADTETILSTSGEIVGPYPRCVVFDRKTRVFEVTVQTGTPTGAGVSLLPQFEAWDGKEVPGVGGEASLEGMMGLLGALGSLAGGEGRALEGLGALLGGGEGAPLSESWAALKLPTEGGTVILSTEQMLEVRFTDTDPAAQASAWEKALLAQSWKRAGEEAGAVRFERANESLRLSATKAGESVLVVLSR
ncbi:MAG: hypothetical protein H0V89_06950 [Deltaproteobacteria bacterium]|nr:hypothetical protein [Deltaproteobacteria bacterium]